MNVLYEDRVAESQSRSLTVLILEDDEVAREALAHWLEQEGYVVHAATGGRDAAEWLAKFGADVLIVDRVYPAWEGLGTLQEVRRLHPSIRILVTERGAELDALFLPMARSVGADRVLRGRLTRDALLHEVRALPH